MTMHAFFMDGERLKSHNDLELKVYHSKSPCIMFCLYETVPRLQSDSS